MKNLLIATALASAAIAAPASASDFAGPRIEVTAGADDVTAGVDPTNITYGGVVGYDLQIGKIVAGVEATAANVFDYADLGAGARIGYTLNENILTYGRVGYSNLERPQTCTGIRPVVCRATANLEGVTAGGGIEMKLAGPAFVKAEYRYTDFDGAAGRHAGLVGFGLRF